MGAGASREVLTNAANSIISKVYTNVTFDEQDQLEVKQNIDVKCTGMYRPYPGAPEVEYESNPSCASCFNAIREQQKQQHEMIRLQWTTTSAPIPITFNNEMIQYYQMAQNCLPFCKACVYQDFSQVANFSWKSNISFDASILTKMRSGIRGELTQNLNSNKGALTALAGVLAPGDKQQTLTYLTNRIMNRITTNVMDSIAHQVSESQTIQAGDGVTKGISQQASTSTVFNVVEKLNLTNTVLSEEEWASYQKLYNDENTVGALGEALQKTIFGITDVLQSTIGMAVLVVIIICVLALVGASGYAIYVAVQEKKKQKEGR